LANQSGAVKNTVGHLNTSIVDGIQDKKGKNIIQLDLRKIADRPADFFIICEGDSNVHVKAISDSIHRKVKETMHFNPAHVEGSIGARWVLMDYFDTVVHVFHKETREFYNLEDLWADADSTEYQNL
jgi:ribosome-associated protein